MALANDYDFDDDFNPRLPRGRRLGAQLDQAFKNAISIHASLAGGDYDGAGRGKRGHISIHASLAGGDSKIFPYFAFGTQHMGILANLS